ncbi:uncharacterized protein Bfra_006988 [Botrytis fragariae]|uniref:Uncharacterized protein n=1 Tax=Botrytis fragariae TaxID=1964551 RepID=A0A8H6AI78_9HELO|nr:uncharacterized protein Bfra_006988 [Botrytis fragariae]KAF5867790.1 hypothetical protein Bfra_006988 [Botrytis fragariae]
MSSSKVETTEAKIARLAEHASLGTYRGHCRNVKDNEKHPDVVRYYKAVRTYNATKGKNEVKKFQTARGPKGSDKEVKKLREIEVVREFEKAEKDMNELAHKEPVKTHREATGAKKTMEEGNPEVVEYNMAKESLKADKETNKAKKSLPQPSASSKRSTPNHPKVPWVTERAPVRVPAQAPPSAGNVPNTPRGRSRGGSRDRSDPRTGHKLPASASKNDERKINSGKHRVPSPHTEAELHFKDDGVDVVRKVKTRKWGLA